MEIIVAPTGAKCYERNFVNILDINVGPLFHRLSVRSDKIAAGIWVSGWTYWEVGLSSSGIRMATLDWCVVKTRHLAAVFISNAIRQRKL